MPISDFGFELSKQHFWDAIRLRSRWSIANLPATCPFGGRFSMQHCMSCKKGGFVSIRNNGLGDLTANILFVVCKDVKIEAKLTPLTGKELESRTANTTNEARRNIRARGVWERGQQGFLYLRVSDPNACCYLNKSLKQCRVMNDQEKKRAYNERVLQIEHGTFTLLFFSIYGNTRRDCHTFYSRSFYLLSEKRDLPKSITMNWIRTKICFALLKSSLLYLRGFRTVCRKVAKFKSDVVVSEFISRIYRYL